MANAMLAGIRRGRMSLPERDRLMAELAALDIEVDAESDRHVWPAFSHLADTYGLAIYDACYLELAIRRGLPLAVSDGRLREAAVRHRIPVLP